MNKRQAYDLCCRYMGKVVCITDNRGQKHIGRITKVDKKKWFGSCLIKVVVEEEAAEGMV
ncbi:hypothetical protein UACE39S_03057 [Ureibacillus acetophenoni]